METAPLKSFATSARTELIREVGARVTAVLAQGSAERVEQPKAVTALERAIAGAGGGDKGKAHVADKVAYTWFNRIIALRFMDANGYTGVGVVSPAADQVGQPEVLAAAKRGQLDKDVVKGANPATITGLLNGTRQPRPGADAQAEAYALLLADYCRFWNTAMPFMFEREGDYTELLIPANLLADDSVLSRSVAVLTEDVCRDVEVIGWLYQFYISERKDEVFAGFKKNKKAGVDEIPAATQLFTPHWIVRYLVENSLGRLWMLNRPSSGLASQMDYYIAPVDEETDFLKISKPEELKVIDPACGSGHMLTYAFDLLYVIYQEEGYAPSEIPGLILANNLYGTEIDPRAGALAAFALTMKAASKRKLFLKNPVEPNICVIDPISFTADELSYLVTKDGNRHAEEAFWNQFAEADTFGSLIKPDPALVQRLKRHLDTVSDEGDMYRADALEWAWRAVEQAEYLTPRYAVVVANPPYMGSGNMGQSLTTFVKSNYPEYTQDLYACFIKRAMELTVERGAVAIITGDTWMSIKSFDYLRQEVISAASFTSFIHVHDSGNLPSKFGANSAFVMTVGGDQASHAVFVRTSLPGVEAKRLEVSDALRERSLSGNWFEAATAEFALVPGAPIAYWLSPTMRSVFGSNSEAPSLQAEGRSLGEQVRIAKGITTGQNARFLRFWWEVPRSSSQFDRSAGEREHRRWVAADKGGDFRRWYGNNLYVIDWLGDGEPIIESPSSTPRNLSTAFQRSLACSKISSSDVAFRYHDCGFVFLDAAVSVTSNQVDMDVAASYLNSTTAQALLAALAPTMNFEVGQIRSLPSPFSKLAGEELARVTDLISASRADWDSAEISWDFTASRLVTIGGQQPGTNVGLADVVSRYSAESAAAALRQREREVANNKFVATSFGLNGEVPIDVPLHRISLARNVEFRHGPGKLPDQYGDLERTELASELVSYAVGCMFGRYSLDEPGLILADQGATLQDYVARVPNPTFTPDADNVIPIVDGDWFEDDVVALFRRFLRTTFGDQHFEENLKFVTESLGVKSLRDYFITRAGRSKFYDDHVQRYKKRPIYWLFSSPKGSFNALVYMHRYTSSTVSTVLTYLREYVTKLESALQQAERAGNAKEADRLRKILVELNEYEHDTLYPKASGNVVIDLDDGVQANYPKFGAALRKITGLEVSL
ncbi:BREX-1 system adenine-specific DNA-methyltransferase PglX [Georgenia muralis]